jgi:AraC-like DNA-binding protein
MPDSKPIPSADESSLLPDQHLRESIHQAKKFIEESFLVTINQKMLCDLTGLNQYRFKKGFKKLVGVSARQYQVMVKIERAKTLLLETDDFIWEIALLLGYEHANNFATEFKRRAGMSPRDWRKREQALQAVPPWIP